MKAFHKTLLPIFLSLLLMLSSCVMSREKTVFELAHINPEKITKIVTSFGVSPPIAEISKQVTDEETIQEIVDNFKNVKLSYEKNFGDEIGGHRFVRFTFYQEDEELGYFTFDKQVGEYNVIIRKYHGPYIRESYRIYKVVSGSFDKDLIDRVEYKSSTYVD